MTKPIRLEHFSACVDWWGGARRVGRVETEVAWRVPAEQVAARGYNLDIKNPHVVAEEHEDPEELVRRLDLAESETARVTAKLRDLLEEALLG